MAQNHDYGKIRHDLEVFLPSVGARVMELRRDAEKDPDFAKLKVDRTIVTKADGISEDLIRAWIIERFPDDSIIGEEREDKKGGLHAWIVDPIDGTENFNRLAAKFSISVGLADGNNPKIGLLYFPAEQITISSAEGQKAFKNDLVLLHSLTWMRHKSLEEAVISGIDLEHNFDYFSHQRFAKPLAQQSHLPRVLDVLGIASSFTFAFLMFLHGHADVIMHPGATPYDIGAMCAIAKEVGLPFSDYNGQALDFSRDYTPIVISQNAQLHEQIIKAMNPGK